MDNEGSVNVLEVIHFETEVNLRIINGVGVVLIVVNSILEAMHNDKEVNLKVLNEVDVVPIVVVRACPKMKTNI